MKRFMRMIFGPKDSPPVKIDSSRLAFFELVLDHYMRLDDYGKIYFTQMLEMVSGFAAGGEPLDLIVSRMNFNQMLVIQKIIEKDFPITRH